jgi:hypothetical protein
MTTNWMTTGELSSQTAAHETRWYADEDDSDLEPWIRPLAVPIEIQLQPLTMPARRRRSTRERASAFVRRLAAA